jgi:hypothetical protein
VPDLLHTLINYDLTMLKIISGKWGLELEQPRPMEFAKVLASMMLVPGEVERVLDSLPSEARTCLSSLCGDGGRLLWREFLRRYGEIREMGVAKRSRLEPQLMPLGVTEVLWYHGLIGRAFFEVGGELLEFAYIPDELMDRIPKPPINLASPKITSIEQNMLHLIHPADDRILDHLTSYLAVVRSGTDAQDLTDEFKQPSIAECRQLLMSCGLLDDRGHPLPEAVKSFLAKPRGEALSLLFTKWVSSLSFNELRLMPGIILEGLWKNDPFRARQVILEKIRVWGGPTWWTMGSFISDIKITQPDFQRSGGDYDSWMIRSMKNGESLRGFMHWDQVDGALIRYILQGPLHWLGFLDLGAMRKGVPPEAFRLSRLSEDLGCNRAPDGLSQESGHITPLRNGTINCPRDVPRAVRYLLARFCERVGVNDKGYLYRITNRSLTHAANQGLQTEQLLALLTRNSGGALPASLTKALQRFSRTGPQTSLQRVAILRVTSPEVMIEILNSPIGRFLGESLSPTTVILPASSIEKITPRLMELGYVCETDEGTLQVHSDKE